MKSRGQMNLPSILSVALKIRVKYYFIEDESPSPVQRIPQRLKSRKQVRL